MCSAGRGGRGGKLVIVRLLGLVFILVQMSRASVKMRSKMCDDGSYGNKKIEEAKNQKKPMKETKNKKE